MKNNRSQSGQNKIIILRIRSWGLLIGFAILALLISCISSQPAPATDLSYYVNSNLGSDSNTGSQVQPFKTIQKCLNFVQPGNICLISSGTYSESLTMKISGTQSASIILKCETSLSCTVNSGNSTNTLITDGAVNYYVIDGFRFITSYPASLNEDSSIKLGSNNNMIFKNNYIEGSIFIRGNNNLVEGNELNGKGVWLTGIWERDSASHDNTYRNNTIHNYKVRAFWSMDSTSNTVVDDNTIHDAQYLVDCDGAGHPIHNCKIINNHLYNIGLGGWGSGVFLENCFDCLIQGNTIKNGTNAPGLYSLNYGQGQSLFNSQWHMADGGEYRDDNVNTVIKNNVFNYENSALYFISVSGMTIDHNTFYSSSQSFSAVVFHAEKDDAGVIYQPINEIITNNIFYPNGVDWRETVPIGLIYSGNFIGNPLFVNATAGDFRLQSNSPACTNTANGIFIGALPCY